MQQISRQHPLYVIFLIDQSQSMGEPFKIKDDNQKTETKTKADGVALCVNNTIEALVKRAQGPGNTHNDYFYISAIGYGGKYFEGDFPSNKVFDQKRFSENNYTRNFNDEEKLSPFIGNAFLGTNLKGKKRIKISELAGKEGIRTIDTIWEDRINPVTKEQIHHETSISKWIEPMAKYNTPMTLAFEVAFEFIKDWYNDPVTFSYEGNEGKINPFKGRPPIIINVTDGMSTDKIEPINVVREILQYPKESEEKVIVFNAYLGEGEGVGTRINYPNNKNAIETVIRKAPLNEYANKNKDTEIKFGKDLFDMSSVIPKEMVDYAKSCGISIPENGRGLLINPYQAELSNLFSIGTCPSKTNAKLEDSVK